MRLCDIMRLQFLTDRARSTVAEELGCDSAHVALVDNATQVQWCNDAVGSGCDGAGAGGAGGGDEVSFDKYFVSLLWWWQGICSVLQYYTQLMQEGR